MKKILVIILLLKTVFLISMEPHKQDYCQKKLPLLDVPVSFLTINDLKYYRSIESLPSVKLHNPKKIDKWPNKILFCSEIYFKLANIGSRYDDALGYSDLFDEEPAIEDLKSISKFVIKIPAKTKSEKPILLAINASNSPFFKDKEGKIYSLCKKDIPRPRYINKYMLDKRPQSPKDSAGVFLITSVYIYGFYRGKEQNY